MFSADSSALKSESDDQRRKTPPTIPRVAALSCTRWTSERMLLTELPGNARAQLLDEEVRCVRAVREAQERRARGTRAARRRAARSTRPSRRDASRGREELRQEGSLADAHERESAARDHDGGFPHDSGLRPRPSSISLRRMDAAQALADLTEISSQIEAAVLFDEQGTVAGSTLSDAEAAEAFATLRREAARGRCGVPVERCRRDAARGVDAGRQRVRRARRVALDRCDDRVRRPPSVSSSTT